MRIERWTVKVVEELEVFVMVQDRVKGTTDEKWMTHIEFRAYAGLPEDHKIQERESHTINEEMLEKGERVLNDEENERVKARREVEKLPKEAIEAYRNLFRDCRDAHDIKDTYESEAFAELVKEYPPFGEYKDVHLEELADDLKKVRRTFADDFDRIQVALLQKGISGTARKALIDNLRHSWTHPSIKDAVLVYPELTELLELFVAVLEDPAKQKENKCECDCGDDGECQEDCACAEKDSAPQPKDFYFATREKDQKLFITWRQYFQDNEKPAEDENFGYPEDKGDVMEALIDELHFPFSLTIAGDGVFKWEKATEEEVRDFFLKAGFIQQKDFDDRCVEA